MQSAKRDEVIRARNHDTSNIYETGAVKVAAVETNGEKERHQIGAVSGKEAVCRVPGARSVSCVWERGCYCADSPVKGVEYAADECRSVCCKMKGARKRRFEF